VSPRKAAKAPKEPPRAEPPAAGKSSQADGPQTAAAAARPNIVIRAAAGTGKTFQLSNRYLELAGAGERPESILASTFARKAAGEILGRVVQRLAGAVLDADACRTLAEQVGWQLDRAACGQLLDELLGSLHRLRIGTLDSFFVKLAGSFTLELGLPTGWQIVEELDDRQWRLEAIRRVLASGKTSEMLALVHLLFKGETTRSISQQIAGLVSGLYDVFCEADKAAWHRLARPPRLPIEELSAAIERLAAAPRPATASQVTAWNDDLARARADDWEDFIAKGIAGKLARGEDSFNRKPIEPDLAALYEPLLLHARGVLVGQLVDQTEATYKLLEAFAGHYRRIKRERSGLRFDDVPRLLAGAMADGMWENASWRLDGSISHLLIDEFQDTSLAQWQVLRPLAASCCGAAGRRSFFSVGDVKQAIYRWRGGVSQIFDAARGELPGISEQSLTASRRSCQVVIDVVNRVFGRLQGNAALTDFAEVAQSWQDSFAAHTTARAELAGYAALCVAPRAAEVRDQPDLTLDAASEKIAQLAAEFPARSIGVLVRRNQTVRQLIHRLRSRHNVAASEEGGNPLIDSPAVAIVLSTLTLADHPGDRAARFHVANSPLGKIVGVLDHDDDRQAHDAMARLRRQLLDEGYGRTLWGWTQTLAAHCDEHDLRRLEQLVALGYTFGQRAGVRPSQFVTFVQQTKVEDPTATQVRVMTVHQAKGLQFDIVVLPELDQPLKSRKAPELAVGRRRPIDPIERVCRHASESVRALLPAEFQKIFEIWPREAVNESLCLLYVAMTRAVHALYMVVGPSAPAKCQSENRLGEGDSPILLRGLRKIGTVPGGSRIGSKAGGEPAGVFPKTFAGILRSALVEGRPLAPGTVAYAHGESNWDRAANESAMRASTESKPTPIRLRTSGKVRHWERRSPSDMEGGTRVRLGDVLRLSGGGLARGSLWHAWLERIEWLDEQPSSPLDKEMLRSVAHGLAAGLDVEQEMSAFLKTVVVGPIGKMLCRSAYDDPRSIGLPAAVAARLGQGATRLVVSRERRFAVREADVLVSGSLDRLVTWQAPDGRVLAADVIDFKTDRGTDAGQIDERVEFYRPQVLAYRRAVERLYGLEPEAVVGRLVFLEPGVVRTVS
jgi:ATP-dependent exoDNAse (exonuclease V) beta subunit